MQWGLEVWKSSRSESIPKIMGTFSGLNSEREVAKISFEMRCPQLLHNLDLQDTAFPYPKVMVIEGEYQGNPDLPFSTDAPYYHQSQRSRQIHPIRRA